jgi:hypothetical protein
MPGSTRRRPSTERGSSSCSPTKALRRNQEGELRDRAGFLNLATDAVGIWSTVCTAAGIERLRVEGEAVNEEDMTRLSAARSENIDPYGKYRFEVEEGLSPSRL